MDHGTRRYPTKVDLKIALIIWGAVLISYATLLAIPAGAGQVRTLILVMVTAIWLIAAPFMWPVDYTLTSDSLIVRIGVIKVRFLYSSIQEVHSESGLLVTPVIGIKAAYSVDRLMIKAERNGKDFYVAISPPDKEAFMRDLQARDSGLISIGTSLRCQG